MSTPLSMTVLIPTYNRVHQLEQCLMGIQKQTRLPQQTIVVVRIHDADTQQFFSQHPSTFANIGLTIIPVEVPGQIAALNIGLAKASGDIISFTDDDAVAHPDWLERIEQYFLQDSQIAGVGGRDWMYHNGHLLQSTAKTVGRMTWYGRIMGNHHLGTGKARQVHHLKGVNMSFRRALIQPIGFNTHLWGQGAQYRNELGLCLTLIQTGWKLIYDPAIAVDHYPGMRHDVEQRHEFDAMRVTNAAHNEMFIFLSNLNGWKKISSIFYCFFVGTILAPGVIQWLRLIITHQPDSTKRFGSSLQGRWQAIQTWKKTKKSCSNNCNNVK